MKKTAAVITAGLLLAACTATQNTAENSPAAQSAQNLAWDKQYGGADKSYDSRLLALREQIAPRFKVLTFKDPQTGKEMQYNLYTPKNLEPGHKYPLVMFIADASTAGKGVKAPLMQGYGGIIWATDEAQAKHPAFVLVPSQQHRAEFLLRFHVRRQPMGHQRVETADAGEIHLHRFRRRPEGIGRHGASRRNAATKQSRLRRNRIFRQTAAGRTRRKSPTNARPRQTHQLYPLHAEYSDSRKQHPQRRGAYVFV